MFFNYLITSFRNIIRHKGFSIFNILGLSLSMSVCMLIIAVLLDQFSYDRFHGKKDRIFRIESIDSLSTFSLNRYASTTYPLAKELKENYTGIEEVVVMNNSFNGEGVIDNVRIPLRGLYTNSAFFAVFDFELKEGSPENILDDPFSIVLKEETAKKYFGDVNPLGKMLQVDSIGIFKITGILKETVMKSHIQFEALASANTLESFEIARGHEVTATNWNGFYSNYIYVLLNENSDLDDLQVFLDKVSMERYISNEKTNISFSMQPLNDIVPGPLLANELGMFLPKVMAIFLAAMVVVILLLAAFNYTSLSIARSLLRAKEIGIRKTAGATRSQIIIQFLFEAVLISVFALLFAIALLQYILPGFSSMQMMSLLEISPQQSVVLYIWFLLFAFVTGLIAGILPSIFMAAFNPQYVLKGVMNVKLFSRITLRKILLVTQFVFSMVFIVSIILLMRQMNYMVNAEMGFDRDVVYNVDLQGHDFNRIKNQLQVLPEISYISAASHAPGVGNIWPIEVRLDEENEGVEVHYFSVDEYYLKAMGIELLAGQSFPENRVTGNEKFVLVDESFIKQFNLGTAEEALSSDIILGDSTLVEIIGIIKDYKYAALFMNPRPLVLRVQPKEFRIAVLRLNSNNMTATVDKMKILWKEIDPNHEMEGDFLDAQIRDYYSLFEDVLYTVGFATLLIIVIASLGLLGMATYTTQTRMKEIGMRKVFGAQPGSVMISISKSYIWLLLIAAIIAAPIAYIINNLWLQYMTYHVGFGAGTLLVGITFIIFAGILTVAFQTLKASWSNPVDILKHE